MMGFNNNSAGIWVLLLWLVAGTASASVIDSNLSVFEGDSLVLSPHHRSGNGHPTANSKSHYMATSDAHHFAWGNVTPSTPGTLTVKYDFRNQNGFSNRITAAQKAAAVSALDAWSAATGGKLVFVQDRSAPRRQIINIGTGNLKAVGNFNSGRGGVLAVGGGSFNHSGQHRITNGVAWQDFRERWDTDIGNGNPSGTVDYFTVVAQEIGHALGLGHITSSGIMNGSYSGEMTALSAIDIEHITSVYGLTAVPLPAGVWLLGSGLAWLLFILRGRRKMREPLSEGNLAAA